MGWDGPEGRRKEREWMRDYNKRPEVQDRLRKYRKRPEVRAKVRAYKRRPEAKARRRQLDRENREYYRNAKLVRGYNFTSCQWDAMWRTQNGLCASCGEDEATDLDHNHRTGQVRALLCHWCNTGMGLFLEDPRRLRAAAEYVEYHAANPVPYEQQTLLVEETS